MIVCSEIRSRERERVVVDRVRILVEELLEEGDGGTGIMVCLPVYVRLGGCKLCWTGGGGRGLGR